MPKTKTDICPGCGGFMWMPGHGSAPEGHRRCRKCRNHGWDGRFTADYVTRARAPGREGQPWRKLRAIVLAEESECWRCGLAVDKSLPRNTQLSPTVDHKVPLAAGGAPLDRANVGLAHLVCNSRAAARTDDMPKEWYAVRVVEIQIMAEVARLGHAAALAILKRSGVAYAA